MSTQPNAPCAETVGIGVQIVDTGFGAGKNQGGGLSVPTSEGTLAFA
jgi:hypothetical protein